MSETVLTEADELIRGDRARDYGHPEVNFTQIAEAWTAYLSGRPHLADGTSEPIRPHDVAQMMILVKVMRSSRGYHRDSAVDIGGYAALDAILSGDDDY